MPTNKISSKKTSDRPPLWFGLLLPVILVLILFAFSAYYRVDKYNAENSNISSMAFQKIHNKKHFGCSYPIIMEYDAGYDTLRIGRNIKREIIFSEYNDGAEGGPVTVLFIRKSSFSSMRETRLNFQKYYRSDRDYFTNEGGFKDMMSINYSLFTSEIKFFKGKNYTEGPFVKTAYKDWLGVGYRLKDKSTYYAVSYLYFKRWIYYINIPGMDTVALRKKVLDIRNSFDFSETHLKEPTFSPAESTAIISALSLLLLACLLVGFRRMRRSLRSRKAKAVYFLHVLCLYALISVYLCLPDICFTSWMRGGLLCLLFTCLGIGILLSMFRKALHKR